MELAEANLLHTYNRYPVVFEQTIPAPKQNIHGVPSLRQPVGVFKNYFIASYRITSDPRQYKGYREFSRCCGVFCDEHIFILSKHI